MLSSISRRGVAAARTVLLVRLCVGTLGRGMPVGVSFELRGGGYPKEAGRGRGESLSLDS